MLWLRVTSRLVPFKRSSSIMSEAEDYLVEGADSVHKALRCPICICLLVRPLRLHCGHSFCEGCITTWLKRDNTCPECRQLFNLKTSHRDRLLEMIICDLKVKCKFKGCAWIGTFGGFESHAAKCNFHPDRIEKWMASGLSNGGITELMQRIYQTNPEIARVLHRKELLPSNDDGWAPFTFDSNQVKAKKRPKPNPN